MIDLFIYVVLDTNRSFRRRSSSQSLGVVWKKRTKPNATKACVHQSKQNNILQHTI